MPSSALFSKRIGGSCLACYTQTYLDAIIEKTLYNGNVMAYPIILTNHKKTFQMKFFRCLADRPKRINMVVPYLGKIHPWPGIDAFARHVISTECKFLLVTQPPETEHSSISLQSAYGIEKMGGQVIFRTQPKLHSKIYQFFYSGGRKVAFVGSANFSNGGFYKNDEIVVFSEEKNYNNGVAREIKRLADYGINCGNWRTKKHVKP